MKRYLAEFDFRYNERTALGVTDAERAEKAVEGVVGKRMTYQQTNRDGRPWPTRRFTGRGLWRDPRQLVFSFLDEEG